jgi:hypothetical protein
MKGLDAVDMIKRLRARYGAPEFAFMEQVRNGVGYGANRTADAVAMGVWPSRGLLLYGFEVKISRGDWLRELKKPEKAEDVVCYMDRWYVVASDDTVVKLEELPPTWGLLVAKGAGLRVAKESPALTPKALDRSLLGALLRNMVDSRFSERILADHVDALKEQHREELKAARQAAADVADPESKQLRKRIADFEKASGLEIDNWNAGEIGRAVKAIMAAGIDTVPWRLKHAAEAFTEQAKAIRKVIGEHYADTGAPE